MSDTADREPTPEEALRALREVAQRRHQVARYQGPRFLWSVVCAVFVVQGLLEDLLPDARTWIVQVVMWGALALAFAVRFRRIGAALGYRAASAPGRLSWDKAGVVAMGGILAVVLVAGVAQQAIAWLGSPWPNTIAGIVSGLLVAFVMPWLLDEIRREYGGGPADRGR
jgi:hypothetical protein